MEKLYTIKEAREYLGVTTKTIQEWDRKGKIKIVRTVGGKRRIPESELKKFWKEIDTKKGKIVGYARVSSHSQKDDLERQIKLLKEVGAEKIITDIGSGLSEKRRGFNKLLKMIIDGEVSKILLTYEDRLTRFGFNTIKRFCAAFDTEIEILNEKNTQSPQEELVKDLITIISHFSGKIYGMRSKKKKEVVESVKNLLSETRLKFRA